MKQADLKEHIKAKVVIGSRAYGLNRPDSDYDRRGWYLAPERAFYEFSSSIPDQLEFKVSETDSETYWELKKYLNLLLACNPTVLETLYTPLVEFSTQPHSHLIDNRKRFISKRAYNTYRGYARQQFEKMNRQHKETGTPDWKNGMHLLRLLSVGSILFETGEPDINAMKDKALLTQVRSGSLTMDEFNKLVSQYENRFEEAYIASQVPQEPDLSWVEDFYFVLRYSSFHQSDIDTPPIVVTNHILPGSLFSQN